MLGLNAVEDDEEYKKRLERARQLRNSFGMITSKDEEINNTTTNNNTYSTKETSDYQEKLNKARKLRNSFGMITPKDIELENQISNDISDNQNTPIQTVQNNVNSSNTNQIIQNNTNKTSKKIPINQTVSANNSKQKQNNLINPSTKISLASNKEVQNIKNYNYEAENKNKIFTSGEFADGYQFGDVSKTILGSATDVTQDVSKGILSVAENVLDIATNVVASIQSFFGHDEVANKTRDLANKDLSERFSSVVANVNPVGMLYNLVNGTPEKILNPGDVKWDNSKSITENYFTNLNNVWLEDNHEKQNYEKSSVLGEEADKAVSLVGYSLGLMMGQTSLTNMSGTKVIGSSKIGASLSAGNIGLNLGGHTLNLSTLAFAGGMAEGLQEANSKGYASELERWSKGFSSGTIEAITEGFYGLLGVGGNDITENLSKKFLSKISSPVTKTLARLGISGTAEASEELGSYILNYLVDNNIIDKLGTTDFSKKWDWKEVGESMALAFVSTGLTEGGSLTIGTNSAVREAESQLGRKLSNDEKVQVTKAVVDGTIDERLGQITGQTSIDNIKEFYTTTFNSEGEVQSVTSTLGTPIENVNKKVNITPILVKNSQTDTYNVIDGKTGLVLDSSPYTTIIQAKAEFAHKIMNLDEASIKGINSKVGQANIAVNNKTAEVIRQAQEIVNSNNSQTAQDNRTQNLNNETSNYMSQTQNDVTGQNKTSDNNPVNDIIKLTEQISDTSVYKNENARDILNRVSQDIPNVEIIEQSGNTYINTLDSEGNVTYQQKLRNTPYTGRQLKSIINNVMENAYENTTNSSSISNSIPQTNKVTKGINNMENDKNNTSQAVQNSLKSNLDSNATNYTVQTQNDVTSQNDASQSILDEKIRNIVKYNQDGKEIKDENYVDFMVKRYKDNQNISGIETDTDNIKKLLDDTYQEAEKLVVIDNENKIRNKQKDLMITRLLESIKEKRFKITLSLKNQKGQYVKTLLNIEISKKGLKESFNKSISNEKYAVVPFLDELIKTSQDGIIRDESKFRDNINEWYYLYNTAEVDGELYGIKIDIKKTGQGDKFYVHRLNIIKEGSLSSESIVKDNTIENTKMPSINTSISQSNNNVKSSTNTNFMQNDENNTQNEVRSMKTNNKNVSNNNNTSKTENDNRTTKYNNYTQKEMENLQSSKIRIANSEGDVLKFVQSAKKMPSNLKLYFGKVINSVSNKIKSMYEIDVSNYNISLKNDDVRKIFKDHGTEKTEISRGQIPITDADFLKIPDIINNPDVVYQSGYTSEEKPILVFEKNIDGNHVVVTYVSDGHHNLEMQTMYKFKNNKKRDTVTVLHKNNASGLHTSETGSDTSSPNTSIPQNNENVKTEQTKQINKPEAGLTNAERADAWIEKEINIVEQTGSWDNTIPVTKRTDIRKTIEDYLGIGIGKGHFRQRAYAIYNTKRDTIRTKELKDIDSILHEVGHALDLGNRLKIDKKSIADELLTAIERLGGYENETRAVKLDEGFAEVIREYAIVPNQAKEDFPQTVAIIEGIRQNDNSFDNFIGRIQLQTYNYIHQNPRNRILGNQSIGEQTDKQQWTPERIKQEVMRIVYDKDYALKDIVNKMNNGNLKASDNAYILTRLASGIGQKVTSMLANGYIDESGKKLFPGLSQLGEILGNDIERFNDLRAYLVAKRDMDYKAKTLKTGIRSMDSKAVVEQFKNDKQIQQAAKLIYDTLDGVMQYAVNNGLITQETAKSLKESNAFYVPMHRVLDNKGNQVGRRGAVGNIIKQRTGSELDVKDVLENIIANSANIIQQVENNNILKALYSEGEVYSLTGSIYEVISQPMQKVGTATLATWENELKNQGVDIENIDFEKTIDIFAPNNKIDTQNLITSFINDKGKRVYLQFKDEVVFNSLMNMDKKFMSSVLKINSKLNLSLRYGATMANIGFAIPNMISDTAQAAIYSTAGFVPVIDNALGVLDILAATNKTVAKFVKQVAPQYAERINMLYSLYEQSGATSATRLSQYRESTQSLMKDVYGTNNSEILGVEEKFKPLKRLLDLMTYIPELSEQSTRFRVFERNYNYYKNKGNSEMDARIMAAIESRDATQDFGRTGNFTREINQLIPFSAARVGSIYTFSEKVKANPKQVGMRIAILTTLAMAIKGLGYDDDEIEELNQRKKDDNFVLKIGDTVVTIKKPQGILRSMINLAEYIQDLTTGHIEEGKEGERLGEWINNTIMDNMPSDSITGLSPNAIAPLIENAINKDFYYNTDIVKSYDLDLPDYQQYYEYNSQLAILLGKALSYLPFFGEDGYSPAKIDNLISGYFGGLGTQMTNAMDYVMSKIGMIPEKPNMGAEDNAIGKRFVVNVNENSASVDEIYNRKTELTKKKNGGTITDEETEELERITEAISNMSSINKQIKSIKADLTMSGEEKSEAIKPLQEQKTDTARQALGKDLIYSENEQKIQFTKFYPSRDTLSQSGYTLNLDDSMKKEYESLAYSYYSKYERQGIYSKDKLNDIATKAKEYAKKTLLQKYRNKLTKSK